MRTLYFCIILLLVPSIFFCQEAMLDETVASLKTKISISQKGEKLYLMDSLTKLVEFNEAYEYRHLAKETINLALSLDSLTVATKMYEDLIFYVHHRLQQPENALEIYDEYISKNIDAARLDPNYLGDINMYAADANYSLQNYGKAIALLEQSLAHFEIVNNTTRQGEVQRRLGYTNSGSGNFSRASSHLQKAIRIFKSNKDTSNTIQTKEAMAILYSQNNFYQEAIKERNELLTYYPKEHQGYTSTYINAASDFKDQLDYTNYLQYLRLGEKTLPNSQFRYFYEPFIQIMLVDALALNDSIAIAKEKLTSFENNKEWMSTSSYPMYLDSKISVLRAENNNTEALKLAKEKFDHLNGKQSFIEQYRTRKTLAELYQAIGNTALANKEWLSYYKIKDSITNVQNVKSLSYYQTLYETEKKDSKIKDQESSLELLETKSRVRNQWFIIAAILGGLGFVIFYLTTQFKQKIAKQQAVEKLRTKISADLHDDVGSLLTGLAMQSEILGKNAPENISAKLERVSDLSRSAMLKMRDAVWVMDARKDNWQSLVDRINEFASEHLSVKELSYKLAQSNTSKEEEIEGATRQHLYLIVKEAIANIIKHSNANTVNIDLSKSKSEIALSIKDNGKVENQGTAGLGVSNMKQRIQELRGRITINTQDGYEILVKIPA